MRKGFDQRKRSDQHLVAGQPKKNKPNYGRTLFPPFHFPVDDFPGWIQNVSVRIIKDAFLVRAARKHPKAASYLETCRKTVKAAEWRSLVDVRRSYPATDAVKVESGRQELIFNVCGNDFRLIAAAHFNRQIVYTLSFLTHAEYSKDRWKDTL